MFRIKILCIGTFFLLFSHSLLMAENLPKTDEVLAQVGDSRLTSSRLDMMIDLMPPQIQVMLRSNDQMRKELINRWVDINLIVQEALASKIDQDPLVKIKIDEMKNRVLVETLISQRLDTQTPIPAEEIAAYYAKHSSEFEQGEQVHAQHILIRLETNASEADKEKAGKTIDMIQDKLKNGESFATLAEQFSEDPGSKNKGGNLGYFGRGQMVKEFEDAAFATKPGETSPPVQTNFGWHLIHVLDRKAPQKLPLEQVSKEIEARLKAERNEQALKKLIDELKSKYLVTVK
ncbi:MAG: peptidylprolyl isomerase [Proteobacteria bacterium]|nr:peptidylprolyl isomerase [Pseudomonadota bacterium]MBU4297339.1 peptidylprolyl isomerase [Pseudomonadota bacterium]MCG2748962.1 peptidylprolyl isomerase [Desulfobulbaceae bacterium]